MYYEVTPHRTVGGVAGDYELESPWDTPAEFILIQISGSGKGLVVISYDGLSDLTGIVNTFTTGIQTPGWRGVLTRVSADTPAIYPYDPVPIENRRVYIHIAPDSSGAIYVTAHWRRQAPESGSYTHSKTSLEATYELVAAPADKAEAVQTWGSNLAADNSSASAQSHRRPSKLRRSNSAKSRSLLQQLTGQ